MLKVVIADDEVRVCRLVHMLADWSALGMEVIGTASNGLEALKLVETLLPDILITDIRMPGCDGLELVEKAKLISPNLEIALISGYAQFEYAQTAMRYDVGGYLLKPIKRDVLTATLEKLGKKCRDRAASTAIMEHLLEDSNKSYCLLRERMLEDLIHKRLTAPTPEQLHSEYGFDVETGLLQVCILKIDCTPENSRHPTIDIIKSKIEEIFKTNVSALCLTDIFQFHGLAGYGVLNFDTQNREQIRHALRQCLNQLVAQKLIFGEFSLAIGKAVDTAGELPLSMQDAQMAIAERLIEGTGRLLESALPASQFGSRKFLDNYSRAIEHVVDTMSTEDLDKAVDELRGEAERITGMRGYALLDLIVSAGKMFAMRINMEKEVELIHELEELCDLCSSADKLFECLRSFQARQIKTVIARRENEAIRPIRIAKQYIQQHYNEQITLEDVCAATGFSTSYFSTMFKKETGEGFSKYLTRMRIERAKALLQNTSLTVAEICDQVGYCDLKHFTSTFKKITSLNPGQYRKLYG